MLEYIVSRQDELLARIAEHLLLTIASISIAAVIGISIAILAWRKSWLRSPLMTFVSLLQTIPGMALLVLMLALFQQIGALPAMVALVLYALLPISRNTLTGLLSTPPTLAEVSRAIGMTKRQQLLMVRLPLAMPSVIAGLRTAGVQCVGLATLAAFVGAGGLGQFINRGLFLSDTRLILLGAIPAALIALLVDMVIGMLQYGLYKYEAQATRRRAAVAVSSVVVLAMLLFTFMLHPSLQGIGSKQNRIAIGSKNFTEQLIVAETIAQLLEQNGMQVERRFSLGGTPILHQAMTSGEIDLAVEYTGTALTSVLGLPVNADATQVLDTVRQEYAARFSINWLPPLGFNNSYALAVRSDDMRLQSVDTISELANHSRQLKAGFDFEFAERPDGYAGLQRVYQLHFQSLNDVHPDLMYDMLAKGQVDVISAYATDGRLVNPGFKLLQDDRHFFPPYDAAIMVRAEALEKHPQLKPLLERLSGKMNDETMRKLNAEVDQKSVSFQQAATKFLQTVTLP